MNRLYVLYDADCGVCATAREWCSAQAQMVPLEFIAANSPRAAQLFPSLTRLGVRPEELLVVDDQGGVYRGGYAWILCLYALAEYRELSYRLASPSLLPLARQAFAYLSKRRGVVSELLGLRSDREMAFRLQQEPAIACAPPESAVHHAPMFLHTEIHDGWAN